MLSTTIPNSKYPTQGNHTHSLVTQSTPSIQNQVKSALAQPYAAIAYEHCISPTFNETNWERILVYYDWLVKLNPSPIVMLNRLRLIVIYKLKSSKIALKELEDSSMKKDWERNYLYHSLLGEIYTSIDKQKAKESFKKAIELTQSIHEKKLLQRKIEKL